MTRQVDVKALISHIVKGDGEDKCRICMGDTSEGQVFLGDTVMMDGSRPISLAELLETITGVEVLPESERPSGLCSECIHATIEAAHFRELCQDSETRWTQAVENLGNLPVIEELPGVTAIRVAINNNEMVVVNASVKKEVQKESPPKNPLGDVSNFQCRDCEKQFVYAKLLSDHLSQSDTVRACELCGQVLNKDAILTHLSVQHKVKVIVCNNCPSVFLKQKAYLQHRAKYHGPGSHSCGDCKRTFKSVFGMNAHNGIHGVKTCPGCDQTFRNQPCYLQHVKKCCNLDKTRETHRTKHKVMIEVENIKSEKKVKVGLRGSSNTVCYCDYCGKKYSGKRYVAAHIQIVHMRTTHRPCPFCGKVLAAAHMSQHLKSHQEGETFTCHHCGILLHSKLGYSQHLRIHTGEKPYPCGYCDETFSGSSKRAVHVRKCHTSTAKLPKHKCKDCPAAFMLPYLLKKHTESVHGQPHEREIVCNVCDMKFSSMRGLVHHSKKHQKSVIPVEPEKLVIVES